MSEKVKDFLLGTIVFIVFSVIMGGCLWYGTSAEMWYAGMHDSECENTMYGEKCHCYERFLEKEKNK